MENPAIIRSRLEELRKYMSAHSLDAFIIPSSDPHMSEYTPARWKSREWISGFGGSAGTAVVTLHDAALWTDSRYFLAAAEELAGTTFELMKDGLPQTPTIADWLIGKLPAGAGVGFEASLITPKQFGDYTQKLGNAGISLKLTADPFNEIWADRPPLPDSPIELHQPEYAGESFESKRQRLLEAAAKNGCDMLMLSVLDEIAWTLNLRGTDVEYNPVFVAYLILAAKGSTLIVSPKKITPEVKAYLSANNVAIAPYDEAEEAIKRATATARIQLPTGINMAVYSYIKEGQKLVAPSPAEAMKAVKNDAEIRGFHSAMLRDGVAMVEFLARLHEEVEKGTSEMGVDRLLTSLRAEQPLFRGLSFATIAAYGPHGAIVHYEASTDTDARLEPRGLLLLDSGAQYSDGTTDITRTIPLGTPTAKEKKVYTLVLKGHIALERCVFPDGASGTQIDLAARYAMWQELMNYGHGTGHGVGSYLNVHEGPHQIRMNYMPAPLHAGMTVTDEPGIYLAGEFGVRIENTLLIVPAGESQFGSFLKFEPLTLCPIDTAPIDFQMMSAEEIAWLNSYHATVREKLMPHITNPATRRWLQEATKPIE